MPGVRGQHPFSTVDSCSSTIENSTSLMGLEPRPLDYMSIAIISELRECDTFQFMVWDNGSGDIDIFVC